MAPLNGKFERSVSLLCWAYNEEASIGEYLRKVTALLESAVSDFEIVLIDDGSGDGTYEIARGFRDKDPRLKIYRNERNFNVGVCVRRAIAAASKEFIFWQTVDWSYDISNLRRFLEYLKTYDIVQGVRRKPVAVKVELLKPVAGLMKLFHIKHLTKRSDTVMKAVISVINYILIRVLFRVPVSDFQNVTFYPASLLKSIKFESLSAFSNPEGLIKSYWQGKTIKEVPINFLPRTKGKAKGTRSKAVMKAFRDVVGLWFRWTFITCNVFVTKGSVTRLDMSEWERE